LWNGYASSHHSDNIAAVPGRYGWDGGLGTSWYSVNREEMVIMMMMTQCVWTSPVHRTSISGLWPTRRSTTDTPPSSPLSALERWFDWCPQRYRRPPDIQLAMLPGMIHVELAERTAWLLSMITSFLDEPIAEAR
jgi:hypothetical protein